MQVKHRDENGQLIDLVQVGSTPNIEEQVATLGMQLSQQIIVGIQKDAIINGLGAQVAQLKLELIALKGGEG